MAPVSPLRRVPPLWFAIVAWRMWKRLPPPVRKRIIQEARKQGPRAARVAQSAVKRSSAKR
jgi:hypothetical protein